MKKLEKYSKNNYDFNIIHRDGNWAIAKGIHREINSITWEVIEVQSHNGIYMGENWIPAKEFPPSNNQWGMKGFTSLSKEGAFSILNNKK